MVAADQSEERICFVGAAGVTEHKLPHAGELGSCNPYCRKFEGGEEVVKFILNFNWILEVSDELLKCTMSRPKSDPQ